MATQLLFRPAARAMKPANQKIMVTASTAQHGEVVVGGGQHHRGEDEVGQRQPGPDGAEDEERDRGGRSIEEEVVVPVAGGWRESEKVSFWFCSFLCCIYPFSSSLGGGRSGMYE